MTLAKQVVTLLTREPKRHHCHVVDLEVDVTMDDGAKAGGALRWLGGEGHRFRLDLRLQGPLSIEVSLGQGDYPWLASGEKCVFKGSAEPLGKGNDPLRFADSEARMKVQMAAGALTGLTFAPSLIAQHAELEAASTDDGAPVLKVHLKKPVGTARLVFEPDGKTPREATWDIAGTRGTVTFHGWRIDSVGHRSFFEPPADVPVKDVDQADIYRMFAALFDFALENLK